VNWSIALTSGDAGGAGTIATDGTYQAPATLPASQIRVRATSVADPTKWGDAIVTIGTLSVAPTQAVVFLGEAAQFSAYLNSAPTTVTWTARLGSVDALGRYQAPTDSAEAQDTVRATVGLAYADAVVTLQRRPPVLMAVSGPAGPGDTLTLTGSGFTQGAANATVVVLFPTGAGSIAVSAMAATDTQATALVPRGCSSGSIRVELRSAITATSNGVPFERLPRVRLRAERADLAAGDSIPLHVAIFGASGATQLTYETDLGTIAQGVYSAPSTVAQTTYANVRACVEGTLICSGETLAVHPFVVSPSPAVVPAGGGLDLSAVAGGAHVPASFALAAGGGSVTPAGHYGAPTSVGDAGQAWLVASAGGAEEPVQVGVTGVVPGIVGRVVDYIDHHVIDTTVNAPRGTYVERVAVGGGRAYVLGTHPTTSFLDRHYFWIDVYDLADPMRPRWVGAVESFTEPGAMAVSSGRLYSLGVGTLAVYDLSGDLPALVMSESTPALALPALDDHSLYVFGDLAPGTLDLPVRIHSLSEDPSAPPRQTKLSLPPDATIVEAATARDGRAFVVYWSSLTQGRRIAAWDLATEPPPLQGSVEGGGSLSFVGPVLLAGDTLYDVTPPVPVVLGTLPFSGVAVSGSGHRNVVRSEQSGLFVIDTAVPGTPRLAATLYAGLEATGSGAVVDNLFYSAEGLGGLVIYDVGPDGGPLRKGALTLGPDVVPLVFAAIQVGGHIYATGRELTGLARNGFLADWDLSRTPSEAGWSMSLPMDDLGYALATSGAQLVLGSRLALRIFSIDGAGAPQPVASLPLDVSCLAVDGNVAWVGTFSGDLVAVDLGAQGGPVELGRVALGATPSAVDVLAPGQLAVSIVSGFSHGDVTILDGSSPATPVVLGRAGLNVPVYGVTHDGTILLLATAAGLVTVDAAAPSAPVLLAAVPLAGYYPYGQAWQPATAASIVLHDGVAWIGTDLANGALHGFDVRNPLWPREVARAALGGIINVGIYGPLVFDGTRAFAFGTICRGLMELDFTQPRNVVLTTTADPALEL
jgi:hypothetical protein